MGVESATKVVVLVSAITAVLISVASFFLDQRIKVSDERLKEIKQSVDLADTQSKTAISVIEANARAKIDEADARAKAAEAELTTMRVAERQYDLAAKLEVSFRLPLARTFAESFGTGNQAYAMPSTALSTELRHVLPDWKARKDLMAGRACSNMGLLARQVVTLEVRNVGSADAEQIRLRFLQKASPLADATLAWHETPPAQYYDIAADGSGWVALDMQLKALPGSRIANRGSNATTVILGSVSGGTTFYGTVVVPVELSWTDSITKEPQTLRIMEGEKASLRASLTGAEIGNLGATCPH